MDTPPAGRASSADPFLTECQGEAALLLGNEAVVRGALEAGVGFASGYPGTPSSEVTDTFARIAPALGLPFEYSVNEKVALEMAFAASLAGVRSICAMKHLGLMYAGDPLSTIPMIGTAGGMVIVSAGDPSCQTSPNEQDQRYLGPMLHLPVLDPATPTEALTMTRAAFALSEESELPVLLRITTRVCHTRAVMRLGPREKRRRPAFRRDPGRLVPVPHTARQLRLAVARRLERARQAMSELGLFRRQGQGRRGIVATGSPAALCRDLWAELAGEAELVLATIGGVHPLPERELSRLLAELDTVLVVEELSPFVEDALLALSAREKLRARVLGKRSGHLPWPFEYGPEIVRRGWHDALEVGRPVAPAPSYEPVPPRPPTLCPGCPHRASYVAARAAFPPDQLYFSDIGCYTLGMAEPLRTADALLSMGAGFTLAAGVSRVTGERTVGFMGDSTFFHAGMPALLDAIKERANMVAVILDNQVTAMTGFQQSPSGLVGTARPPQRTDIEAVVRALGAGHVEKVDPADLGRTLGAFERARDARGVSVIICEHPCPTHERRAGAGRTDPGSYVVDPSRCRQCGRSDCGLRCQLGVSVEHERHMARGRSLVVLADDRSTAAAHATAGPRTADGPPVAPVASCAAHCPLGLCIQGYAGHIAAGQHQEALALIMSRNPLPDSVCRVCHRPCERACVRAGVDEPVAVNDLKRFVMDWAARTGESYQPAREPDHGLSVAVVGAGPSGLAAAHELRLRGYDVTVLDAAAEPGGLLRYGIPRFRLPADALDRDVARILGLGVRFEGGRRLGADMTIDELFARGFDAVYLAVGASRSLTLSLPGTGAAGAPRLDDALALLAGDEPLGGEHIVVVGGGNAAVDAARTAVRRGAASVTIAYRRSRAEMPALPEEIEAALGEGIALETELGPVSLAAEPEGALACVRMRLAEPDASGRRRPVPIGGAELLLRADRVVVAVGQTVDGGFAAGATELSLADGVLPVDPASGASRRARVFAGGDLTAGPRTVTDAIADGQRAAWGIDRLLRGEQAAAWRAPPPRPGRRPSATGTVAPARLDPIPRARPPALARAERTGSFREVGLGLDEAGARAEARRCLACGSCGNCRCCLDVLGCPAFGVEDDRIRIDARVCTRCGQCLQICPNGAIVYLPAGEAPPLAGSPGGS